jgi:hypothetical protein
MTDPFPVMLDCGCAWESDGRQIRHCGSDRSITSLEREAHIRKVASELALRLASRR